MEDFANDYIFLVYLWLWCKFRSLASIENDQVSLAAELLLHHEQITWLCDKPWFKQRNERNRSMTTSTETSNPFFEHPLLNDPYKALKRILKAESPLRPGPP
jgi:hypothetical protein